MSVTRSRAIGCGMRLPDRVVTNDDLALSVDTSDEWIRTRTGIARRHFAAEDELTSDLAIAAARDALVSAGASGADVDMIVLATATPDQTFPATATRVQHAIGMTDGFAFDVQAVCAGFTYALATADNFIRAGQAKTVLVIGAETFSRIMDWSDRSTCVLFGDGAGALLLRAETGAGTPKDRGVLATRLHSDGAHGGILYVDGGPSSTQTAGFLRMEGKEVFRHAIAKLSSVAEETLAAAGATGEDVDWIVPHQANIRILEGVAKRIGASSDKLIVTIAEHGNTSAASIPLALAVGLADGRIREGDLMLMQAIGGGLSWGGAALRW